MVLALLAGCGGDDDGSNDASTAATDPPEFSYTENGGPDKWGSLSPDYKTCDTGTSQSPVNLGKATRGALPPLEFHYEPGPAEIVNNGHSVEVEFEEESSSVTLEDVEYALVQAHYHLPSEHQLGRIQEPIEFHLVHQSHAGELLVVGVLVRAGAPSEPWGAIASVLPPEEGESAELPRVDPSRLLPADAGEGPRWSYDGSLTTPPCTEDVQWNVLQTRLEMSPRQIQKFKAIYSANNRPLQPRNGREIVVG